MLDQTVQATSGRPAAEDQADTVWDGHQLGRRYRDVLRVAAAGKQRAGLLPDGPTRHAGAEFGNHPGGFQPDNVAGTRRRRVPSGSLQQVRTVDSSCPHPQQCFTLLKFRVGHLAPGQVFAGFREDCAHSNQATTWTVLPPGNNVSPRISAMEGLIAGRTASQMPGLDIAELRSWQNFLEVGLRLSAALNRELVEAYRLTLMDVRLLDLLNSSATGTARMGDLAERLTSLPSRVTRQIRRLEGQGLVSREASPDDGRGVLAKITDGGRDAVSKAMITYSQCVRQHFLGQLSRPQVTAMGENCRRINAALRLAMPPGLGR